MNDAKNIIMQSSRNSSVLSDMIWNFLQRIETRLVFCNRKLTQADIFFTRSTKHICNFVNPDNWWTQVPPPQKLNGCCLTMKSVLFVHVLKYCLHEGHSLFHNHFNTSKYFDYLTTLSLPIKKKTWQYL